MLRMEISLYHGMLCRHVLLVGAKHKLANKCFVLRNLLSHYHWRLSGRDVAFEQMTDK